MKIQFNRLDHIQICVPTDQEEEAREFYLGTLQLKEVEKPESIKSKGGFWAEIAGIQLHIGVEPELFPTKRHPAFEVEELEAVRRYLNAKEIRVKSYDPIPGFDRFSFFDPFGNRIELLGRQT